MTYKLRDKIQLILKQLEVGGTLTTESGHTLAIADGGDEPGFLMNKIVEETYEVLHEFERWNRKPLDRSKDKLVEETAGLKQALETFELITLTSGEVNRVKYKKYAHRGGFCSGVVWDGKK